jgi:IS1 family transposase
MVASSGAICLAGLAPPNAAVSVLIRAVGDRSEATCRRLWEAIPQAYRTAICYSDLWGAYAAVAPALRHRPVGKERGETAHIERFNNTLRQRLGRLVRKTLSFSKPEMMLVVCLRLLLHSYNQECVAIRRIRTRDRAARPTAKDWLHGRRWVMRIAGTTTL